MLAHKHKSRNVISLEARVKISLKPTITYHDFDIYVFTKISIKHGCLTVEVLLVTTA